MTTRSAPLVLPPQGHPALIPAGFSVLIRDPAWCGLIFPRSGRGHRDGLILGNGTGVIDADYEGPLMVSAWNRDAGAPIRIEPGERIAQLVFTRIARPVLTVLEGESDVFRSDQVQTSRVFVEGHRYYKGAPSIIEPFLIATDEPNAFQQSVGYSHTARLNQVARHHMLLIEALRF